FTVFLYKYRIGNTKESGKMHHNSLMETIWFIIPVIIVIALAIPTVNSLYSYEEKPQKEDDPLVVYATSAGYKWFFSYPEQKIETVNHLTIPKDRP
ncbi:cytochrome c oxidase subunit II transmembrane domain-containing protein, partial [Staphylococcus aureus]|nr:cytochrome c oxidase subunit II transmembrane domain-containing protein [Staphylococcus aureus]